MNSFPVTNSPDRVGDNPELRWLTILLTRSCNLRCEMCHAPSDSKNQALSIQRFLQVIARSRVLSSVKNLSVSGGEPLLLGKDLIRFIQGVDTCLNAAFISISTNGSRPDILGNFLNVSKELRNRLGVFVSFDGLEKTHDRLRGAQGVFHNGLRTLDVLSKHQDRLRVGINFTASPSNVSDISAISQMAQSRGLLFNLRAVQESNWYYRNIGESPCWTEESVTKLKEAISEMLTGTRLTIESLFKALIPTKLDRRRRDHPCFAGAASCLIDSDGSVYPCVGRGDAFGSVKSMEFDRLFSSSKAHKIRNDIRSGSCCCWTECDVVPTLTELSQRGTLGVSLDHSPLQPAR